MSCYFIHLLHYLSYSSDQPCLVQWKPRISRYCWCCMFVINWTVKRSFECSENHPILNLNKLFKIFLLDQLENASSQNWKQMFILFLRGSHRTETLQTCDDVIEYDALMEIKLTDRDKKELKTSTAVKWNKHVNAAVILIQKYHIWE